MTNPSTINPFVRLDEAIDRSGAIASNLRIQRKITSERVRAMNLRKIREWVMVHDKDRFDLTEAVMRSIEEVRRMGYEPNEVHRRFKPSLWSNDFLNRVVRNYERIAFGRRLSWPKKEESVPTP